MEQEVMANAGQFKNGEKRPGPGRPAGRQNNLTTDVKAMILGALNKAGGEQYLIDRAKDPKTATAFMALVGRVLPKEIKADVAATHVIGNLTPEQQKAIAEAILGK